MGFPTKIDDIDKIFEFLIKPSILANATDSSATYWKPQLFSRILLYSLGNP
jgi:hypothetical protein